MTGVFDKSFFIEFLSFILASHLIRLVVTNLSSFSTYLSLKEAYVDENIICPYEIDFYHDTYLSGSVII